MLTKFWFLGRRFKEGNPDAEGGNRPTPEEVNRGINDSRLSRLENIARRADGNRARELSDVEGERLTGQFSAGEFDDSPEARERAAEEEDARARQALDEQREAAAAAEAMEAARLQSEGAAEDPAGAVRTDADDESSEDGSADQRMINGEMHYAVAVNGQLRWLTLKQLREDRAKAGDVDKALQDAQAALQSAAASSLRSPPAEEESLDDETLGDVFLAASMGDREAVQKLVPHLRRQHPGLTRDEIAQEVSRRLATQREIEAGEAGQRELIDHPVLGSVFKQRFNQLREEAPTTRIREAYAQIGAGMRKDFAAMLGQGKPGNGSAPILPDKATRKRTLVSPPSASARQSAGADPEREVPVSETIDQMARGRGQSRAIRQGRS